MTLHDFQYYTRRALQEDEAAASATCEEARDRHQELADAYRLRCSLIPVEDRPVPKAAHRAGNRRPIDFGSAAEVGARPKTAPKHFCPA